MRATVAAIGLLAFCVHVGAEGQHDELEIPEPMVFDLVHGLGVEKGAFEANVLALFPLNDTSDREIDWAPEVEYAVADASRWSSNWRSKTRNSRPGRSRRSSPLVSRPKSGASTAASLSLRSSTA